MPPVRPVRWVMAAHRGRGRSKRWRPDVPHVASAIPFLKRLWAGGPSVRGVGIFLWSSAAGQVARSLLPAWGLPNRPVRARPVVRGGRHRDLRGAQRTRCRGASPWGLRGQRPAPLAAYRPRGRHLNLIRQPHRKLAPRADRFPRRPLSPRLSLRDPHHWGLRRWMSS